MAQVPPNMQQLFSFMDDPDAPVGSPMKKLSVNQYGPSLKQVTKGSLISFNYLQWKHDPYPLVVVTDIFREHIRGVNLHYLTFPYIKRLLNAHCDNMAFSYFVIKTDSYMVDAFRTYKRMGIRQIRKLDCNFLLKVMATARTFNPAEVEAMRRYIQEQLRRQVNPQAKPTAAQYMGRLQPGSGFIQTGAEPPQGEFPRI